MQWRNWRGHALRNFTGEESMGQRQNYDLLELCLPIPICFSYFDLCVEPYSCRQISSNQFGNTCDLGRSLCCSEVRSGEPDSIYGRVNAQPLYFITHWTSFDFRGNGHFAKGSSNCLLANVQSPILIPWRIVVELSPAAFVNARRVSVRAGAHVILAQPF
jgi:hypothetical protein